ncbi:MAG: 3-oxoacyl-[acyl-carrier-protein] reductase [Desulfobulbaceae bacterium]|nr:MAG: 3-oxoacyl-[acyl-carrier-protein] reductase [Desulfobulbaceae bacterium]
MNLQGKTAVVTGGSRGIGRAISLRLAAMGALVYINYVSRPDAAEETKALIEAAGGVARTIAFDVADGIQIQDAFKRIADEAGRIDILVNNAGITRDGLLARMKESDWDQVLATNLKGAFLCTKAVSKTMMKQRWGRVVNISSVIGFAGNAGQVNYAAAKAGLIGMTKAMARELASRNITVNSVAPGYIQTDMTDALPDEARDQLLRDIPLACLGTPEDVAGAVAFLVGEDGRYLTGQTLHVNGGMYM